MLDILLQPGIQIRLQVSHCLTHPPPRLEAKLFAFGLVLNYISMAACCETGTIQLPIAPLASKSTSSPCSVKIFSMLRIVSIRPAINAFLAF